MFGKHTRAIFIFSTAIVLWALLPLTSQSTPYMRWLEIGNGYTPVANFRQHHAPPKIRGKVYKDLVLYHKRYSILWLPLGGAKNGQYGLYKYTRTGLGRHKRFSHKASFVPLSFNQANQYARTVNVNLTNTSPVNYWELYFGWLVIAPLGFILVTNRQFFRKINIF